MNFHLLIFTAGTGTAKVSHLHSLCDFVRTETDLNVVLFFPLKPCRTRSSPDYSRWSVRYLWFVIWKRSVGSQERKEMKRRRPSSRRVQTILVFEVVLPLSNFLYLDRAESRGSFSHRQHGSNNQQLEQNFPWDRNRTCPGDLTCRSRQHLVPSDLNLLPLLPSL